MAERPYWSGDIRVSLVSFAITLKSALKRGSQVPLHEFDRRSGHRIHHRNVTDEGHEVKADDVVKGIETGNGSYVSLEKEEIDALKLPSSDTLELVSFVPFKAIPLSRYERPYFIIPGARDAKEIYAVFHQALRETESAGIGQIAMRGREELCAVIPVEDGLMLQTLRYNSEVSDGGDVFPPLPKKLKSDYVALANQLIHKNTQSLHLDKFHDRYHEALLSLINAKKSHKKPSAPKAQKPPEKIIDFAEALRKSLGGKGASSKTRPRARKKAG